MPCLCAGVTCVVRGAIRCGRDFDVATDFFCGAPSAGKAINAVAAKQLIKPNPLLFMTYSFLSNILVIALPRRNRGVVCDGVPTGLKPWDWRDVPLIRRAAVSRMRRDIP